MSGRDNNFNLLRVLAASFIAYYHCHFMTLGPLMVDGRYPVLYQISQFVLSFFFVISGFLIARSYERRRSFVSYFAARMLRLLPGVFVLSLLLVFVVGPLVTETSLLVYFSSPETWAFVPLTTLLDPDRGLPGVFASNINSNEVDQALWTLRYEVICYLALGVIGVLGILQRKSWFALLSLAVLIGYVWLSYFTALREIAAVNHLTFFGLSFFIGTGFYVYRAFVPLGLVWLIALVGAAGLAAWLYGVRAAEPVMLVACAYFFLWLAFVPVGRLRAYNQLGDFSYGIYIYHFPVQQVVMSLGIGFTALPLFLVTMPIVVCCGILSWHLVEQPALSLIRKHRAEEGGAVSRASTTA